MKFTGVETISVFGDANVNIDADGNISGCTKAYQSGSVLRLNYAPWVKGGKRNRIVSIGSGSNVTFVNFNGREGTMMLRKSRIKRLRTGGAACLVVYVSSGLLNATEPTLKSSERSVLRLSGNAQKHKNIFVEALDSSRITGNDGMVDNLYCMATRDATIEKFHAGQQLRRSGKGRVDVTSDCNPRCHQGSDYTTASCTK